MLKLKTPATFEVRVTAINYHIDPLSFRRCEVRYYVRPCGKKATEHGTRMVRGKYEEGGRRLFGMIMFDRTLKTPLKIKSKNE